MQLPFIKRAGTDPDALAYFSRAGIASGTQTPSAYDNAASFNPASSQFLTSTSNIAPNGDFTVAFWCNPSTSIGQYAGMFGDDLPQSNASSVWACQSGYVGTNPISFYANVRLSGGSIQSPLVSWTLGAWNFVVVQYNDTTKVLSASVNNQAFANGTAGSGTTTATARPFRIGQAAGSVTSFNGAISNFGYWNRRLSSGTNSEISALYNSGAGRTYGSLDSGLLTGLVSWWALNGTSSAVSLTDSHGGNNLTNNGSVTAPNIGPVVTSLANSRRLISDFVRGIKSLGLWNSMVCWPLRSSQNASTTLTARSLGGLGTFDGTLVGLSASAWASDGLNIVSNTAIVGNAPYGTTAGTLLGVTKINILSQSYNLLRNTSGGGPGMGFFSPFTDNNFYFDYREAVNRITIASGITQSQYFCLTGYASPTGSQVFRNTTSLASNTTAASIGGATTDVIVATNSGGSQTSAFAMLLNSDARSNHSNIYNLYKSTLGIGLGLP